MAVEFRLLGEVEARVGGRGVDIGHARQRCVLAVLLVEANRVVRPDQLLDRVWADRLPQRARITLSSYLSRLRQVLQAAAEVGLARRGGGYVLTVDPMAVDLHRFRHLVNQARASDDDELAVALFERALALWRGEAFAGLETPWLNAFRGTLDAERLAAELDRNDVGLAHGRHTDLLGELVTRAADYPLDERLAGQLILAQYRTGRQADALHHFEQLRLRLAEELGTDPSPPLQLLHKQILSAGPSLIVASGPTARLDGAAAPPVPRQLPLPPRAFTGRACELAALNGALATADHEPTTVVISAVSGTAGVGKTALALHWAHQVADAFHDGHLYVNLRGFDPGGSVMSPADAVRGFLDALEVPPRRIPADLDAQAALYRSQLADRRMLILLDNARDAEQVRPLLPGAPGCLVLVTSRNQLTGLIAGEGAHPLSLGLLTSAEAHDLLTARLGPTRVAAAQDAIMQIIASCARLPLALSIVAARAATHPHFPLDTLAEELREARNTLDALANPDPATDVRVVFSWSYQALTDQAARLFRLLGLHPGPDIAASAAASLAGTPRTQARSLLAELADANLVNEHIPGRYAVHDLLRAYATELVHANDSHTERQTALHRVLDHYLHTAVTAALLLAPARNPISLTPTKAGVIPENLADSVRSMAWFTAEYPVLLGAIHLAATVGFDTHAWQLAWTLGTYSDLQGKWRDLAATHQTALDAAHRLAHPGGQAYAHRALAHSYVRMRNEPEAHGHLRHALDLYGALGDRTGLAQTHLDLAWSYGRRGHYAEAIRHVRVALDLYRVLGDEVGQARALNMAGWFHAQLGDNALGIAECEHALTLFRQLGDRDGEAAALDSLGYIHHHLGRHRQAIDCYKRALAVSSDHRETHAAVLTHLGDCYHASGGHDAARDAWQQALTILEELDYSDQDIDQVRAKLDGSGTPSL